MYASCKRNLKSKNFCFLDLNLACFGGRGPPWKIFKEKILTCENKSCSTIISEQLCQKKFLSHLLSFQDNGGPQFPKAILKFRTPKRGSKWAQNKKSQEPKIDRNCINYLPCNFQPSPWRVDFSKIFLSVVGKSGPFSFWGVRPPLSRKVSEWEKNVFWQSCSFIIVGQLLFSQVRIFSLKIFQGGPLPPKHAKFKSKKQQFLDFKFFLHEV